MSKTILLILNWNKPALTIRCLGSLKSLTGGPFHTIVVDNGSTDDSCHRIQEAFSSVELISLKANLGYAGGNNIGIQRAVERDADYVLILNNDVYPEPDIVSSLLSVAEECPSAAILGPKMFTTDSEETIFCRGSFVQWKSGKLHHRDLFRPGQRILESPSHEKVDFIVGCCLLVRRQFIEKVGCLDTEYYLNYEDVDWGIRAGRNGFDVLYVPSTSVKHDVSATLGSGSPANTYYMTRNSLRFFWLNAPGQLRFLSTCRILSRTVRTILAWSFWSRYQNDHFKRKKMANLMAIRDFFRGRFGKMGDDVTRICYPSDH